MRLQNVKQQYGNRAKFVFALRVFLTPNAPLGLRTVRTAHCCDIWLQIQGQWVSLGFYRAKSRSLQSALVWVLHNNGAPNSAVTNQYFVQAAPYVETRERWRVLHFVTKRRSVFYSMACLLNRTLYSPEHLLLTYVSTECVMVASWCLICDTSRTRL
jgi:hypothetical protein